MEILIQDLRYALRMLVKNPGFTALALVTLALGISANGVVFSFLYALLLRPLPFKDPHRIVAVQEIDSEGQSREVSSANYVRWKEEESQSFEQLAGYRGIDTILAGRDFSDQLMGAQVTRELLPLLGAEPALGRGFMDSDYQASSEPVAVISDSLWQRRFEGNSRILGQTLSLDGKKFAIVGVVSPQFWFWTAGDSNDVWIPLRFDPQEITSDRSQPVHMFGRLRAGKSLTNAQTEMEIRFQRLVQNYPGLYNGWNAKVLSLRAWHQNNQPVFLGMLRALPLLLGAVGFVLLTACTNLASLILARSLGRYKEMAIRAALGADRRRLVRQLLAESLLLSGLAGVFGLLLVFWGVRLTTLLVPEEIKWILPGGRESVGIDLTVAVFTLLVSLLTALIFGLLPALRLSKANLNETLKEGGRTAGAHSVCSRESSLLVIFEIAMSLVLMIGATLMLKSFVRLARIDVGFNPERLVAMLLLSPNDSPQAPAFYHRLIQRVKELPGVEGASLMTNVPAGEFWLAGGDITIEGRLVGRPLDAPQAIAERIDPDFLKTMEIPLLKGRAFTEHDTKESAGVALISQSLAQRYFRGVDPIGRRLRPGGSEDKRPWLSIVGIVADIQHKLNPEPIPTLYGCYQQQDSFGAMYLFVRTALPVANVVASVRKEVWQLDQNQPVTYFWTMNHVVSASIFVTRFITWLLGIYAALSLLFASIGIYGVVSYSVSRRTQEIGIRMALGAHESDVLKLFVRRTFVFALVGVGAGVAVALAVSRLLRSQLHGVSSTDPWTFVGVSLLLVAVVLLACYLPARRATKVNPIVALRCE